MQLLILSKYKNIDEAQNLPELFSALQVVVDENKDYRYILSGSSDFLLMQNISQTLAGRVAVTRLLPLSICELNEDANIDTNTLMWKGFYLAVWGDKKEPKDVYDSYVSTYLHRDVRQILNIKDLCQFQKFLTIAASRVGNVFIASSIASELGVDYKTIQSWMSILETSYTAFLLQPFYRNIGKRLTKTPKIYFYDIGLVCHLLGIENEQHFKNHPLRGAIFENMVICEMLKKRYNKGLKSNLFFYRDNSAEVDVIQEEAGKIKAYEIKSAERFNQEFTKSLSHIQKLLGDEISSSYIVYSGEEEITLKNFSLINYHNV